jgi:hypothetical protein
MNFIVRLIGVNRYRNRRFELIPNCSSIHLIPCNSLLNRIIKVAINSHRYSETVPVVGVADVNVTYVTVL